jgi:hypothetical protein
MAGRRRPARFLRAPVLAVLALAACGGDDPEPPPTAVRTAEAPGALTIVRPFEDDRVRATRDGGRLGADPLVEGTSDPAAAIVVNGGCNVQGCVVHTTADERGRWRVGVRLDAPAGDPEVRITAYYRGSPLVGPNDEVGVRLAAPRRERAGGDRGPAGAGGRGPGGPPVPPESLDPPAGGPAGSGPRALTLVGDSLAVGIEDLLPGLLPGWRVNADALTTRPLDAGMGVLARMRVPRGSVIAISLFTNDDPSRTAALEAAVRETVRRAGPGGCAVWATIARPPFAGRSYAGANALLRRLDADLGRRLTVIPWAENAARAGWLAADRVHATPEGYRRRAELYAEAARSCG